MCLPSKAWSITVLLRPGAFQPGKQIGQACESLQKYSVGTKRKGSLRGQGPGAIWDRDNDTWAEVLARIDGKKPNDGYITTLA